MSFIEAAKETVNSFCQTGLELVNHRKRHWELLEALYYNRIGLRDWSNWYGHVTEEADWESDYLHAPGYLVDAFVERIYPLIFTGSEYLTVEACGGTSPFLKPDAGYKISRLLVRLMDQGQIQARITEALTEWGIYGTVFGKVFWKEGIAGERGCPIVQVVPLWDLIPDSEARHNDIQRWRGIAHRIRRERYEVLEGFRGGWYELGLEEFFERWPEQESHDGDPEWLELWEYHGSVGYGGRLHEIVMTIVTDDESNSPDDGIVIRLEKKGGGLRPFVSSQFTTGLGCYGIGVIERNEDILFQLSQLIGQVQDNARICGNACFQAPSTSPVWKTLDETGGRMRPGLIFKIDSGNLIDKLSPVEMPRFPSAEINSMIEFLSKVLERRSGLGDVATGVKPPGEMSATEASLLMNEAQVPIRCRADLFVRTFLEPAGKLALDLIREHVCDGYLMLSHDGRGGLKEESISELDFAGVEYKVYGGLTHADTTRIARAASLERVMQSLPNFEQRLMLEGYSVGYAEIFRQYLDAVGVTGTEKILKSASEKPVDFFDESIPFTSSGAWFEDRGNDVQAVASILQEQARPNRQI